MSENINENKKSSLLEELYPKFTFEKVEDIPQELLKENDIKLILMDMDNTLIDYKGKYSEELKKWIETTKNNGIKLFIVSNSFSGKMAKRVASELGVDYIYKAGKPSRKGLQHVSDMYPEIEKEQILMMGDQLFTDVWAGNRFDVQTLLVKRINKKEIFISKVKRPLEKIVLKYYYEKEENKDKCKV